MRRLGDRKGEWWRWRGSLLTLVAMGDKMPNYPAIRFACGWRWQSWDEADQIYLWYAS